MGSIHKHTYHKDGQNKSILLFVNPESYSERNHITLKISYDDGKTWPENKKILLDEYNGRGYSCITSVNENTIGILYESSQADMVFQQIKWKNYCPKPERPCIQGSKSLGYRAFIIQISPYSHSGGSCPSKFLTKKSCILCISNGPPRLCVLPGR